MDHHSRKRDINPSTLSFIPIRLSNPRTVVNGPWAVPCQQEKYYSIGMKPHSYKFRYDDGSEASMSTQIGPDSR